MKEFPVEWRRQHVVIVFVADANIQSFNKKSVRPGSACTVDIEPWALDLDLGLYDLGLGGRISPQVLHGH
jgi:hypothetical protein